ncbi:MAG: hypothetical protein M1819_005058 [Sarea resinae]|nr:MAG: hypothetical protein M1819_005058 [Sarea resinae]
MAADAVSTAKPTIVFCPGAWHLPQGFDAVRAQLAERGFESEAVALPAVGAEPPTKTFADDVAAVRSQVQELADQGKAVIVIMHSYGGLVGADAVQDLGHAQRAKAGQKGGVIMMVYMSAFVGQKGKSVLDMLGGQYLPWMKVDGDYCFAETPENIFYHDLAAPEQEKWISLLRHTCTQVYTAPVAYEPWHDIPCMFLFCENDQAIALPIQELMAAGMGDITTFRCAASHSPFLSMPHKVVEALEIAAKVGLEKSTSQAVV